MPPTPRTGRAPARPVRTVVRSVAMVLSAVLLFAGAAFWTLHFKQVGERGVRAERDLQRVVTEFQTQDALEWRAISGRAPLAQVAAELAQSRDRGLALMAQAGREGVPAPAVQQMVDLHQEYSRAVDGELRLLGEGRPQEAEAFDEAHVDPAFAAARSALAEHTRQIAASARRAQALSDGGVLASVALAMVMAATVYGRRRLAEVREQQVRHSEARYRALVDQSADIVIVIDRHGRPEYLSPAAERLFRRDRGHTGNDPARNDPTGNDLAAADRTGNHPLGSEPTGSELTSRDLAEAIHPDDREMLAASLATADPAGKAALVEVRVATGTRDPGWRHFEVSMRDLCAHPAVRGIVLTGHDVTDRRALQREAEHRALHDNLTGLPNRALLQDRLSQSLRTAHRQGTTAGLLLIDLDRFKEINDTLGHHYGDQLLAQVGPRLAGELRKMDTVARLGGDEFAVLLPSVRDLPGATEVAQKLQAALSRPFQVEGVRLDVEASIGVVISGAHGDDASTLIQRADIAMYVAKQRNLGVSSYDREVDSNTPERLALLGDLRRALHNDELFLHYQPKVDLRTGRLCGAEALLRWQHPERGLIPPDAFIPLAENTGLIGPLTNHVLDLALARIGAWAEQGRPLPVAVNLSARNLLDDTLDRTVRELLTKHGVGADLLKLEVTESAIMTDPVRATGVLQRLAALGISISIDDFGAGYTSIRQLKDLPICELKIDRSFVTDVATDPSNAVIVRSVIDLGHNLGLSIVAEGVETQQGLDCLGSYGCDIVQGYIVSRPLPVETFETWRDTWPGLPPAATAESARPQVPVQVQSEFRPGPRDSAGRVPHA
jgi:diguanylate cyclase (GGDEF)-like protein